MMDEQELEIRTYKRKQKEWLLTFCLAALFIYFGYISDEFSILPSVVHFIFALIAIVHGIWQLTTPYIIISDERIIVKRTLLKIHRIDVDTINSTKFSGNNVIIDFAAGEAIINLNAVVSKDVHELKESLQNVMFTKENEQEENSATEQG